MSKERRFCAKKGALLVVFLTLVNGLYAQKGSSNWNEPYFSLDFGGGSSDVLVDGLSFGLFLEPKFSLSPAIMIGSKNGLHISTDDIIALETQVFFRWNFLRLGSSAAVNFFIQGGAGFLGAFKGTDVKNSRASLLFDATLGITIPLAAGWHIEPSGRIGYPFIGGFALTVGYKFPLPQKTIHELEHVEIIRTLPPNEIIKRVLITQVEYIIFAPDTSRFNAGVDHNARSLNELVIHHVSKILMENSDLRVRIEGHANPVAYTPEESERLLALSSARANEVAGLLKEMGVKEEQIILAAYGTTRTVASDHDHWDMNRRVELIIVQIDAN